MKFLSTYRTYYKVGGPTRGTVLAANVTVGLAQLFDVRDRNGNGRIDDFDRLLPISERFFSGGSTTLRGYKFEEAGPRQVIVPQGQFRDRDAISSASIRSPFQSAATLRWWRIWKRAYR